MDRQLPGSKLLLTCLLLSIEGGYLDAYTYVTRDGVFANAQTANIVKLAMNFQAHNMAKCMQLLIPVSAFILGVLVALIIESHHTKYGIRHIRRSVLLVEIAALVIVAYLPEQYNTVANCLVSFVCAMQMEAFKTFVGQVLTTTVSTGNLRKFVEFLYKAIMEHDEEALKTAGIYLVVILSFMTGAYIGYGVSVHYGFKSIFIPVVLLVIGLAVITYQQYRYQA